MLKSTYRFF